MFIEVDGKSIECFSEKSIVLFGAGSYGEHAVEEFENIGAKIVGFIDNNPSLAGKTKRGYPVFLPDYLKTCGDIEVIITSTYEKEIRIQLESYGIRNIHSAQVGVLHKQIEFQNFRNQRLTGDKAKELLYAAIISKAPFFCGRLGSVELECIIHYLYFLDRRKTKTKGYPNNVKHMMNINAGFFPVDNHMLDQFCELYLRDIKDMDFIWTMWNSLYEDKLYHELYEKKCVSEYDASCLPAEDENPWTEAFAGKKVLVVHPFEESIKRNYAKREQLFANQKFLPEFELLTIKAVQSIAGTKTGYDSWFDALEAMKRQMDQLDFDIALVGAGAYGLPLAAYAKSLGKIGIHLGGILQIYFGIKGRAWDDLGVYNQYWTTPLESERPENYRKVENGRYWS